jgi:hypothetical protein
MQETFQKRERVEWQRSYKQEKGVEAATRTAERKLSEDSREEINAKRPQDGSAERTTVPIARKAPIEKGRPAQEYHPDADSEEEHLPHISKLTSNRRHIGRKTIRHGIRLKLEKCLVNKILCWA